MRGQCIPIRVDKQELTDVLYWELICTPVGIILEGNPMEPQLKLLYTKREAAQLLSLSVRSIDYLITVVRLPLAASDGES